MQAVGMVNDHTTDCHRHAAVAKLGQKAYFLTGRPPRA